MDNSKQNQNTQSEQLSYTYYHIILREHHEVPQSGTRSFTSVAVLGSLINIYFIKKQSIYLLR